MNKKTIIVTLGIITGMVGLAVLANCLVDEMSLPQSEDKRKQSPGGKNQSSKEPEIIDKVADQKLQVEKPHIDHSTVQVENSNVIENSFAVEQRPDLQDTNLVPVPINNSESQPVADEFPLRLGSSGKRVERLQVWLMRNYGHIGKVTGIFDEETQDQLKKRMNITALDEPTFQKYRMGKHVNEQVIIR